MISIFILVFVLLVLSFALANFFKVRIEDTIPVAIMSIISLIYLSGFFGNLKLGFYVVCIGCICAFVYSVFRIYRDYKESFKVLSPYVIIFVLFSLWCYHINNGRLLCEWDEFTHWGFTTKIMCQIDKFSNEPGTSLYFVDYIPGTALFQYFVQQFVRGFNEGFLSMAQGIFVFSFCMPVFSKLQFSRKDFFKALIAVIILFSIPLGFYSTVYSSLYVDAALGMVFAYLLFQHFCTDDGNEVFYYIKMSLGFIVLCLIKSSGIGLAALAFIIMLADNIVEKKYYIGKKIAYDRILLDIVPLVMGILFKKMWSIRLAKLGYSNHFDTGKISFSGILKIFSGKGEAYQQTCLDNFWNAFINIHDGKIGFGTASYALLFIMGCVMLYVLDQRKKKKKYLTLAIATSCVFFIYSFYMLCLYLFTYSESEAINLASFSRYEYTIIMGIVLALAMLLLVSFFKADYKSVLGLVFVGVILFSVPSKVVFIINNSEQIKSSNDFRAGYDVVKKVEKKLKSQDKVYIVSENNDGLDYFVTRYSISPAHTQTRADAQKWSEVSWDLGTKTDTSLGIRREIGSQDWMDYMIQNGFNYVFIFRNSDQFVSEYSDIFEQTPTSQSLYRIDEQSRKLVLCALE